MIAKEGEIQTKLGCEFLNQRCARVFDPRGSQWDVLAYDCRFFPRGASVGVNFFDEI